jgi:hydroxypyruvate isomerase
MKLCYNTNGLRSISVIQAVKELKKAGYEGVELALHKEQLNPFTVKKSILDEIKDLIAETKIVPVIIATGCDNLLSNERFEPSLITSNGEGRNKRIELIKRTVDIAKYLGFPALNLASGIVREDNNPENAKENLMNGLMECLNYDKDFIIALEPEPNMFIEKTTEAIEIIEEINMPNLKLNLDLGHVYCCEEDYLEKVEKSIKHTYHMHIEDIKNRIHFHEIPGTGEIDFDSFFSICAESGYSGYFSVELYNHNDVWEQALDESKMFISNKLVTL